ncbi:hypothetical protein V2S66_16990 [Streptomyces sp. V4-01]|uniref:Uncharacterized protein n=1 Tax=Actinacidiphila polyblastidii TaxID=3110430 RepID=A0ABU7PCY8_9ACTN|nr:hypothetical protein [Streptomyces sp. V4-01]
MSSSIALGAAAPAVNAVIRDRFCYARGPGLSAQGRRPVSAAVQSHSVGLFLSLTSAPHNRISGDTAYVNETGSEWAWFQKSGMADDITRPTPSTPLHHRPMAPPRNCPIGLL